MKDDPLRLQLRTELRELRKGQGAFAPDRVAVCEALVRVVGMGSAEQAHATLFEMFKRYSVEPDGDIRAYLETSGVGLLGASLNKRLEAYALAHHVEERTGLRRSDRGADKLATLFRDEALFFRPWANLTLYQFGPRVLASIALHIVPESEYRPPAVWVNDELQAEVEFDFSAPAGGAGYLRALQHIDQFRLNPDGDWMFKINIEWRMPVWPQWVLAAQLADPRLVAKIQTQRNFMTEATIVWGAWPGAETPRTMPFAGFPRAWPGIR
ncbi:hypothetical protein C5C00_01650 [Rathayibacter rathayi]|uniref:hypothetical protein n=1 Tax=Rathayibacter rathayi TaxID=33887 RepID=UPI000CE8D8EF|nr:hypothetical protein [Rathayibacter rathayi]PPG90706.1 hypothetical protein C5C47_00925 [Rathayibacter rathayi]PPG98752.1 hypothetical protein C5C00_01650 [Rathayibacter rathayi]